MAHPKEISSVLGELLSGLQQQQRGRKLNTAALLPLWRRAVGEYTTKHAVPVRVRGTMLFVIADSAALAEQLQILAPGLLERLSLYAGRTFSSLHIERIGRLPVLLDQDLEAAVEAPAPEVTRQPWRDPHSQRPVIRTVAAAPLMPASGPHASTAHDATPSPSSPSLLASLESLPPELKSAIERTLLLRQKRSAP